MGILNTLKRLFTNDDKTAKLTNQPTTINVNQFSDVDYSTIDKSKAYYNEALKSIFLYWAKKGKPIYDNSDSYPRYFLYEYGLSNPTIYHKTLINDGYLTKPDLNDYLNTLKVADLKEILTSNSLSKSGKKADLVERILSNIPNDKFNPVLQKINSYVITDKGNSFIKEFSYFIDLRKNIRYDISVDEFLTIKSSLNFKANFNDVCWKIFNSRTLKYTSSNNWGFLRNNYMNMADLLYKEKKYSDSLMFYLQTLFLDLSGMDNSNTIDDYELLLLPPGLVEPIIKLKDYFLPDMIDRCYKIPIPFHYFSREIFINIINAIFNDADIDLKDYKKFANKKI